MIGFGQNFVIDSVLEIKKNILIKIKANEELIFDSISQSDPDFFLKDAFEDDLMFFNRIKENYPMYEFICAERNNVLFDNLNFLERMVFYTKNIELELTEERYDADSEIWNVSVSHKDFHYDSYNINININKYFASNLVNSNNIEIIGELHFNTQGVPSLASINISDSTIGFNYNHIFKKEFTLNILKLDGGIAADNGVNPVYGSGQILPLYETSKSNIGEDFNRSTQEYLIQIITNPGDGNSQFSFLYFYNLAKKRLQCPDSIKCSNIRGYVRDKHGYTNLKYFESYFLEYGDAGYGRITAATLSPDQILVLGVIHYDNGYETKLDFLNLNNGKIRSIRLSYQDYKITKGEGVIWFIESSRDGKYIAIGRGQKVLIFKNNPLKSIYHDYKTVKECTLEEYLKYEDYFITHLSKYGITYSDRTYNDRTWEFGSKNNYQDIVPKIKGNQNTNIDKVSISRDKKIIATLINSDSKQLEENGLSTSKIRIYNNTNMTYSEFILPSKRVLDIQLSPNSNHLFIQYLDINDDWMKEMIKTEIKNLLTLDYESIY